MRKLIKIRTAEYDRMADRGVFDGDRPFTELLDGLIYERAAISTPHMFVVVRLQQQFTRVLEDMRLLVHQPLIVDTFNEPLPDLTLLREPLARRKPRAEDSLAVIEVSDDATYEEDRTSKMPGYLAAGVPLVWIVNLPQSVLEEYTASGSRVYHPGDDAPSVAGVSVDLRWLLADLPDQ